MNLKQMAANDNTIPNPGMIMTACLDGQWFGKLASFSNCLTGLHSSASHKIGSPSFLHEDVFQFVFPKRQQQEHVFQPKTGSLITL